MPGPLQLLSPPFLMTSTTKQMRPNGKGAGVSTKTDAVMLNFYQWCKTPSSAFSKKISATTPIFCTFSVEPLVIYNCVLIENSRTVCEIFDF